MSEENKNNLNKKLSNFKPQKFNNLWIILIILTGIAIMWNSYQGGEPVKTEWFSVKEKMIPAGDIEKIVFVTNENMAEVFIRKDSLSKYKNQFGGKEPKFGPQFYFIVSGNFNLEEQVDAVMAGVEPEKRFAVETEQRTNYFGKMLEWLLLPLMLIGL